MCIHLKNPHQRGIQPNPVALSLSSSSKHHPVDPVDVCTYPITPSSAPLVVPTHPSPINYIGEVMVLIVVALNGQSWHLHHARISFARCYGPTHAQTHTRPSTLASAAVALMSSYGVLCRFLFWASPSCAIKHPKMVRWAGEEKCINIYPGKVDQLIMNYSWRAIMSFAANVVQSGVLVLVWWYVWILDIMDMIHFLIGLFAKLNRNFIIFLVVHYYFF